METLYWWTSFEGEGELPTTFLLVLDGMEIPTFQSQPPRYFIKSTALKAQKELKRRGRAIVHRAAKQFLSIASAARERKSFICRLCSGLAWAYTQWTKQTTTTMTVERGLRGTKNRVKQMIFSVFIFFQTRRFPWRGKLTYALPPWRPSNPLEIFPGVNSTPFCLLLHFGHFFLRWIYFSPSSSNVNDAKRHQNIFRDIFFAECLIRCTGHNEKRRDRKASGR